MSGLIGKRPTGLADLPPRRPSRLARAGECFYCRTELKTDTQVRLHFCDPVATSQRARRGDRLTRNAL